MMFGNLFPEFHRLVLVLKTVLEVILIVYNHNERLHYKTISSISYILKNKHNFNIRNSTFSQNS